MLPQAEPFCSGANARFAPLQNGSAIWIDRQIGSYPQSRFVVTSRPGGYKEAPLHHPRRSILGMQSFTFDQRREFLENVVYL